MLLNVYLTLQVILVVLFLLSFFIKSEITWAVTLVLAGLLMFSSYNVEHFAYVYNTTTWAYQPVTLTASYNYLAALNLVFFSLALLLAFFDIFEKYSQASVGHGG